MRQIAFRKTSFSVVLSPPILSTTDTGEVVANANDEITEDPARQLREAGIRHLKRLYTNELDRGAFISNTLARR
jgi:hypothetical protein